MTRFTLNLSSRMGMAVRTLPFTVALILTMLVAPPRSSAQGRMGWSELSSLGLTTIYVSDERGVQTPGVIRRVTPDSLVIALAGGEDRAFQASQVARIERRGDSLRNGALIGAGFGALSALSIVADCPYGGCGSEMAIVGLALAGVYGLVGTGIDALIVGRTTVYRPESTPASRSVAAIVRPSGGAVRLGLRVGLK